MDEIERRLHDNGMELPEPIAPPSGTTVRLRPVNVVGDLAYISGHGPADGSRRLARGKVGSDLTVEQAQLVARQCGLAMLASLRRELGGLGRVRRWLKVTGYVNCTPDFEESPAVLNGFSDLLVDLWGRPVATREAPSESAPCRSPSRWRSKPSR